MNNYALSEDQELIVDTVRKFAQEIEPKTLDRDEHAQFAQEPLAELGELGLLALPVPEDHGGAGMGMVAFVAALEELGGVCGSTARLLLDQAGVLGLGLGGVAKAEALHGAILTGETLTAFVGRDCGVQATFSGGNVVVEGAAPVVVAGAQAAQLVVAAKTAEGEDVLLSIAKDAVECGAEPALGFRAAGCVGVRFNAVTVGEDAVLVRGDEASAALDRAERAAWLGGAAIAVGISRRTAAMAKAHADERIAFGKPLTAQDAVAGKLTEARIATDAARHQTWHAARLWDGGAADAAACAMARISAVRAAITAADDAIQIHGGYGYTVEYHVERHYRDAQALEVMDRGSRVQLASCG